MKQKFNIEIIVNTEEELDEVDIQNILKDVINFECLDWEVEWCYDETWPTRTTTTTSTSFGSTETIMSTSFGETRRTE